MGGETDHAPVVIRFARADEASLVSSILQEAAEWLLSRGEPLWRQDELAVPAVRTDVAAGHYLVALVAGEALGVARFTETDALFWPDAAPDEASYIHRLAVRRSHGGRGIPPAILDWAGNKAAEAGRRYLRLDCDAARHRLRAYYERLGFAFHSERTVGPYRVARYEKRVNSP